MPIQVINIIRELTDSVSSGKAQRRTSFCAEINTSNISSWEPNTDIIEGENEVIIKLEVAGVQHNDVSIKVKNGRIHICGIRKEKVPDKKVSFHQLEISYGHFERVIIIPEFMLHNHITANIVDGILEINISKKSEVIEIPITDIDEI